MPKEGEIYLFKLLAIDYYGNIEIIQADKDNVMIKLLDGGRKGKTVTLQMKDWKDADKIKQEQEQDGGRRRRRGGKTKKMKKGKKHSKTRRH